MHAAAPLRRPPMDTKEWSAPISHLALISSSTDPDLSVSGHASPAARAAAPLPLPLALLTAAVVQ